MTQVSVDAAARLDRLPIGPFHRRVLRLIGMGMFFDSFDNSMMAGVLATLVSSGASTMTLNATFISATFIGLTIGAATAGFIGDNLGRRFAYQFNLLIFGSMCLVAAAAPSMEWLIGIRCIVPLFANYGIAGVVGTIATMYLALVVLIAIAGIETNQRSLESLAPDAEPEAVGIGVRDEAAL